MALRALLGAVSRKKQGQGNGTWSSLWCPGQSQAINTNEPSAFQVSFLITEIQPGALGHGCQEMNSTSFSFAGWKELVLGDGQWNFGEANTEGLEQLVGDCPECLLKTVADVVLIQGTSSRMEL